MTLTNKQKKIIRLTFFLGILLISTFSAMNTIFNGQLGIKNTPEQVNQVKSIPSSSAFWTNTSIIIDATATTNTSHSGNWTWAVAQDWCTGLGTWEQPYLIENMTFTADFDMNGLLIKNSVEDYFKINNCTLENATTNSDSAGLNLEDTSNGTITECNMSKNTVGLLIGNNCNNITIIENYVNNEHTIITNNIGIKLGYYAYNNTVLNNSIENAYQGISLLYSDRIQILDNNLTNCARGIELSYSINNTIQNNSVFDNLQYGIQCLQQSNNNTLIENTIKNSGYSDFRIRLSNNSILLDNVLDSKGIFLEQSYHNQINQGNTVSGKPIYYYEDQNDLDLNGDIITNIGQLFIINSSNSKISNFVIDNVSMGICIDQSSQLNVSNNNISNNTDYGLYLRDITQSSIIGNIANNNKYGIYYKNYVPAYWDEENPDLTLLKGDNIFSLNIVNNNERNGIETYYSILDTFSNNIFNNNIQSGMNLNYIYNSSISQNQVKNNSLLGIGCDYSQYNSFSENMIINNTNYGLYLDNANHTVIEQNYFELNYLGIYLYDSHHCSIENNEITSNLHDGIQFEIANETKISNNIISFNMDTGIKIDTESYNNIIFQNFLIQNTVHAEDNGFNNQLYFQNIGNYWDNYTGVDVDNNGIGDTSHSIVGSANNSDLYPIFELAPPVIIENPINASFMVNQTQLLNWTIQDLTIFDGAYIILLNGTEVGSGTWESNIQFSFNLQSLNLEPGIYNVTIIVSDGLGYSAEDSVLVVINPEDEPEPEKISGWLIFLFIVLGLSAISVTSMIVLKITSPEKYDKVMATLKEFFSKFKKIGKSD